MKGNDHVKDNCIKICKEVIWYVEVSKSTQYVWYDEESIYRYRRVYLYNVHIPVYIHYTVVHVDCGGKYSMIKCTIWYIEESEVAVSAPA